MENSRFSKKFDSYNDYIKIKKNRLLSSDKNFLENIKSRTSSTELHHPANISRNRYGSSTTKHSNVKNIKINNFLSTNSPIKYKSNKQGQRNEYDSSSIDNLTATERSEYSSTRLELTNRSNFRRKSKGKFH